MFMITYGEINMKILMDNLIEENGEEHKFRRVPVMCSNLTFLIGAL